jgi:hypothetical protein
MPGPQKGWPRPPGAAKNTFKTGLTSPKIIILLFIRNGVCPALQGGEVHLVGFAGKPRVFPRRSGSLLRFAHKPPKIAD